MATSCAMTINISQWNRSHKGKYKDIDNYDTKISQFNISTIELFCVTTSRAEVTEMKADLRQEIASKKEEEKIIRFIDRLPTVIRLIYCNLIISGDLDTWICFRSFVLIFQYRFKFYSIVMITTQQKVRNKESTLFFVGKYHQLNYY